MTSEDRWMWFLWWPLVLGGLVGFGVLGIAHPHADWGDMAAGGCCVLLSVGLGILLGLRIRQALTDQLTKWATGAQELYDQEALHHERTADVLFDLAYGMTSASAAQEYLAELDNEEEDDTESTEEPH